MRKQTSLRTTQSASARERFLLFALRIVPAMAIAKLIAAAKRLVESDEAPARVAYSRHTCASEN
jgi:hypothetical protein